MDWLLIATGFSGALTFVWLVRLVHKLFWPPPSLEAILCPAGDSFEVFRSHLQAARREILVVAPRLAHPAFATSLVDLRLKRKVNVEILLDAGCERDPTSDLSYLLEQGLRPLVDANDDPSAGTFLVIDRRTVVTGSFQLAPPMGAAQESVLVMKGQPATAGQFLQAFNAHKAHARLAEVRPVAEEAQPTPVPASVLPPPVLPDPVIPPPPVSAALEETAPLPRLPEPDPAEDAYTEERWQAAAELPHGTPAEAWQPPLPTAGEASIGPEAPYPDEYEGEWGIPSAPEEGTVSVGESPVDELARISQGEVPAPPAAPDPYPDDYEGEWGIPAPAPGALPTMEQPVGYYTRTPEAGGEDAEEGIPERPAEPQPPVRSLGWGEEELSEEGACEEAGAGPGPGDFVPLRTADLLASLRRQLGEELPPGEGV